MQTDRMNRQALNDWGAEILASKQRRGFMLPETPLAEILMNLQGEITELWEEYRHGRESTETYYKTGTNGRPKPCGIPSELADMFTDILALAAREGIDLDRAVAEKLAYDDTRPYRHGGMRA